MWKAIVCLIQQQRHWHYNFKQIIINTDDELINGGSYDTDVDWIYTCLHHPIITYDRNTSTRNIREGTSVKKRGGGGELVK
jgi:hypothetical protein